MPNVRAVATAMYPAFAILGLAALVFAQPAAGLPVFAPGLAEVAKRLFRGYADPGEPQV